MREAEAGRAKSSPGDKKRREERGSMREAESCGGCGFDPGRIDSAASAPGAMCGLDRPGDPR